MDNRAYARFPLTGYFCFKLCNYHKGLPITLYINLKGWSKRMQQYKNFSHLQLKFFVMIFFKGVGMHYSVANMTYIF